MRNPPVSLGASSATKKPSKELRRRPSPDRKQAPRKYERKTSRLSPASSPGHEKVSHRTLRLSKLTDISTNMGRPQIMDSKEAAGWPTRPSTGRPRGRRLQRQRLARRRTRSRRRAEYQAERCQWHPAPDRTGTRPAPRPARTSALTPTARRLPEDPPKSHRRQLRDPLLELDRSAVGKAASDHDKAGGAATQQ